VTAGDEVSARHDYPSHLQRNFDQHGFERVQVLNFGNAWYGFSQIYVMWKNVAGRFSCDFILLLPMKFWSVRDTTFNHTYGLSPGYIHARLILENDEIRLISPIGETAKQRLGEYLRPIPHWRYLRYDRHPPNIFESMLPSGRTLPNPFYYDRRSELEEAMEIYARIIQSMADDGAQVVILFNGRQRDMYPSVMPVGSDGIGVVILAAPSRFPYVAPARHPSSWGQELLAKAFFRILTGDLETAVMLASTEDRTARVVGEPAPLYSFSQARVTYLGRRAGYFVRADNQLQHRHDEQMGIFRRLGIGAVLALESPDGSLGDACLLPLRNVPPNESELIVVRENADGSGIVLGTLHQLQPEVAIFRVVVPNLPRGRCLSETENRGQLLLGDETIASFERGVMQPSQGPRLALRDINEHLALIESLTTPRIIHLELGLDDGTVIRRPFLTIQTERVPDYLELISPPARLIERQIEPAKKDIGN
jgi:hypothetical protein